MKPINSVNDIRRVVTGERGNGVSYFVSDGPPVRVDGTNATLWATDYGKSRIPVRNAGDDPTPGVTTYFGAEGDTRFTACWHLSLIHI